jgi:hypothetical protein
VKAGVIVIDSKRNQSAAVAADFTAGDIGGPKLSKASYGGGKLRVKGKRFSDPLELEINGRVVAPTTGIEMRSSGRKLVVEAEPEGLNLRGGANRVRVVSGGLRSNILVMDM